ncbi:MAG TPA: hypothetical protein DCX53_02225 [Anaerolineae bacterium]|nr:hypothetical protein [Anaerolineae bacterium]
MRKYILFIGLGIVMLLASCGGGGAPSTAIDVVMTDFQFVPNQFVVPAGEEITISIVNSGAVVHNFVIMKLGTTAGQTFEEDDQVNVYWEEVDIQPGGDFSTIFTAPTEPGEYQIICRTEGHIVSGMIAKLIVVAGE